MPLTFPSHAAAVLPLKRWRPKHFDGVALVVGSASPDLAYALDGSGLPVFPLSHQWLGILLFCLPVTLAAGFLVRWAAPEVARHLPGRLAAYGVLGSRRPRLIVTVASAMLGAATHLGWDRVAVGIWDLPSTIAGAVLALYLLYRFPPTAPATATAVEHRPAVFWPAVVTLTGLGTALATQLPGAFLPHTTGARVLIALGASMVLAAAAVRALRARPREVV